MRTPDGSATIDPDSSPRSGPRREPHAHGLVWRSTGDARAGSDNHQSFGREGCHLGTRSEARKNDRYTASSTVKKHAFGVCRAHSQFENRSRREASPGLPLMRCFTGHNHLDDAFEPSYPEGNFEGNQLLGGSIGLSPLCHTQATQFARQNSD